MQSPHQFATVSHCGHCGGNRMFHHFDSLLPRYFVSSSSRFAPWMIRHLDGSPPRHFATRMLPPRRFATTQWTIRPLAVIIIKNLAHHLGSKPSWWQNVLLANRPMGKTTSTGGKMSRRQTVSVSGETSINHYDCVGFTLQAKAICLHVT